MEVTASNFKSVLPEVEAAIKKCTFMSIDCEMTGLNTVHNINVYDTPKQYYEKVRKSCKEFLVIQYGLSMFRYDKDTNLFKHQTYNFYIFRRPMNRNIPDQRFLCQTSSIQFLISQGFDFNKLFKEGISYLNQTEQDNYKNNLEDIYKRRTDQIQSQKNGTNDSIPIPDDAKSFMDEVEKQIEVFLENEESELRLPKCNAFYRRLVYQMKTEKFQDKISLETRQLENKDRILFVTRLKSKEEEKELAKQKFEEQLSELEDFVGFTKVLKMIVDSGKLIVGHNLCLDFLHTIDKFLIPLPEEYEEFKDMAHSLFPKILDTKYMSSSEPFKDLINSNILKHLLDTVCEKPFKIPSIEAENGCQSYSVNDEKEHEAGFDAFVTGLSFISMWKYLAPSEGKDEDIFGDFSLLEPYLNRIFLMVLTDNQYINLGGDDLMPSRDHVFYLTFPREWKANNITQLFSPFGNIYISWLDDSSAYISLYKKDQAAIALSTLSQSDTYSIMTFARRQAILAGIRTPLPSPIMSKKRKSSDGPPPSSKKRRTDSFNSSSGSFTKSKRSIDPIEEEQAECEDSGSSQKHLKMFDENDTWE
ncbi:hypothetical protein NQ318_004830 [Aromia moschata]|uniref:Poly(A)-specific ribonuclease RNA-binding domain-containing protein n=1 Tax=Aromia moschata TaxID=1265417 RepID=A0AAV8Z1R7_9CUCU|nr:hypothetical protein NQ318_004830 [Aromia moschata]